MRPCARPRRRARSDAARHRPARAAPRSPAARRCRARSARARPGSGGRRAATRSSNDASAGVKSGVVAMVSQSVSVPRCGFLTRSRGGRGPGAAGRSSRCSRARAIEIRSCASESRSRTRDRVVRRASARRSSAPTACRSRPGGGSAGRSAHSSSCSATIATRSSSYSARARFRPSRCPCAISGSTATLTGAILRMETEHRPLPLGDDLLVVGVAEEGEHRAVRRRPPARSRAGRSARRCPQSTHSSCRARTPRCARRGRTSPRFAIPSSSDQPIG